MINEPYNDEVRKLFAEIAHAGQLAGATIVLNASQGVRVELSALVEGQHIRQLRFRAWGCPHTIAACEAVCANIEGGETADLENFAVAELMQTLAVPAEKSARILVIEDTVRQLGAALRNSGIP